ncbi:MAG: Uma2 family endonuclease [Ferruginibacter sp.]|nr:Uma2 family endonuclease [Cytophagales bacterium]
MATVKNIHHSYTVEQYVALEQESELRYEFYRGEVFAMTGGTMQHNLIIQNMANALRSLRSRGCRVFTENVKLEVAPEEHYVYPDVMLTCHPQDLSDNRLARYPSLVIEVLSESTEAHDRGKKLDRYLQMPGLQAYVMISQKAVVCWLLRAKRRFLVLPYVGPRRRPFTPGKPGLGDDPFSDV